eukprot:387554-Rhodomonas_salina.1
MKGTEVQVTHVGAVNALASLAPGIQVGSRSLRFLGEGDVGFAATSSLVDFSSLSFRLALPLMVTAIVPT